MKVPLISQLGQRGLDQTEDSLMENCYPETQPDGRKYLVKRPGAASLTYCCTATLGRGIWSWGSNLYSVFGARLFKNGTSLTATISNNTMVFGVAHNDGEGDKLILMSGNAGYAVSTAGTVSAIHLEASATAFIYSWAPGVVFLDGYLFAQRTVGGEIYHTGDTYRDWPPLNVIPAESYPDKAVAIARHLNYIVSLGEDSTEFFYDAANTTGSVLARVDGATLNFGCFHGNTVQNVLGSLIWVNQYRQVMLLENMRPSIISTPAVARLIGGISAALGANVSTLFSMFFSINGHVFYILTYVTGTEAFTIAYDLMEKAWFKITSPTDAYWPFSGAAQHIVEGETTVYLQHRTNGNIYTMKTEDFTEMGGNYTMKLRSNNTDFGESSPKSMRMLQLIGDRSTGSVKVRYTDDDASTWSATRSASMALAKPRIHSLGDFTQRAFELSYTGNDRLRLYEADFEFSRVK